MNAPEDGLALIQAEQLRQLHAGMPASIVSGTMLAALLAYAQRSVIDSAVIVAWFSLIAAIGVARAGMLVCYRRAAPAVADSKVWLQRCVWVCSFPAQAGGLGGWLLFPAGETALVIGTVSRQCP